MQIQCDGCKQSIEFEEDRAGSTSSCPYCGSSIKIPESINPFEAPKAIQATLHDPNAEDRGMIGHMKTLAILMIVHACLLFIPSLFCIGIATAILFIPEGQNRGPEQFEKIMVTSLYGVLGITLLTISILQIISSIQLLRWKGRVFGIVALSSGLLTIFSCWCAPFGVALFVYGLIVLINKPVYEEFKRLNPT